MLRQTILITFCQSYAYLEHAPYSGSTQEIAAHPGSSILFLSLSDFWALTLQYLVAE